MANPSPLDAVAYVTELAQWHAVGALGEAAGIAAAQGLPEATAGQFGAFADSLGIDPASVTAALVGAALPAETSGLGSTLAGVGSRAWAALSGNARKLVETAAKHQGLALTIGGLVVAHSWLTQDESIALAEIREKGEVTRAAWNGADPATRAKIVKGYLESTSSGPGLNTVLIVGGVVLGVVVLARAFGGGRR